MTDLKKKKSEKNTSRALKLDIAWLIEVPWCPKELCWSSQEKSVNYYVVLPIVSFCFVAFFFFFCYLTFTGLIWMIEWDGVTSFSNGGGGGTSCWKLILLRFRIFFFLIFFYSSVQRRADTPTREGMLKVTWLTYCNFGCVTWSQARSRDQALMHMALAPVENNQYYWSMKKTNR